MNFMSGNFSSLCVRTLIFFRATSNRWLIYGTIKYTLEVPKSGIHVCDVSTFTNLKELRCVRYDDAVDLEILGKNLTNLEILHIKFAIIIDVLPFVHHSKKWHPLYLYWFVEYHDPGRLVVEVAIVFATLNKERQKLKDELQGLADPEYARSC